MEEVMDEVIFQGYHMNLKLLSDLDLGGPDDLKPDLRGQLRSLRPKMPIFKTLKGFLS